MFNNLIESQSHRKEFKRRSRFLLATTAAYALAFFAAGIASIYAYDAQLEAQSNDLTVLSWIPPVAPISDPQRPQPPRKAPASNNTNRIAPQPSRPILYESTSDPRKAPNVVSATPITIPPAPPGAIIGPTADPPRVPSGSQTGCATCPDNVTSNVVRVEVPPQPPRVVPRTQPVTSRMLISKAIILPQPVYPAMAKQIRLQGTVLIQILVDESGRVVSAQVVSGNPMLTTNAKEAALRARFTPTILNDQPVKVQGVITYNFVLQ
jgi:protein TonB